MMQGTKKKAATKAALKGVDPRFAALARLLARAAARRDFEKELSASQSGGYSSDSDPEDTP